MFNIIQCPFCLSSDVEYAGTIGCGILSMQYYCKNCDHYFTEDEQHDYHPYKEY